MQYIELLVEISQQLQDFAAQELTIYTPQDLLEITVFILTTHSILTWLKQDHTKPLLQSCYSYSLLTGASYYFGCSTLLFTMVMLVPIMALVYITLHHKQLQKNFILTKKKSFTPATFPSKNWIELFIRSCLIASHKTKQITCIIEQHDQLSPLLHKPFNLDLSINSHMTDFILASKQFNEQQLVWINQSGIMHAINTTYSNLVTDELYQTAAHDDAAQLITTKTDAIMFHMDTQQHLHTLWYQGTQTTHLTVQQLLQLLQSIIDKKTTPHTVLSKGANHDRPQTPAT